MTTKRPSRSGFRPESRAYRAAVQRDGDTCRYCGYPADQVDHIEPYSYRHNNALANLVVSCARCNTIAGPNYFSSFEEKRDWILERRRPEILRQLEQWEREEAAEREDGAA